MLELTCGWRTTVAVAVVVEVRWRVTVAIVMVVKAVVGG